MPQVLDAAGLVDADAPRCGRRPCTHAPARAVGERRVRLAHGWGVELEARPAFVSVPQLAGRTDDGSATTAGGWRSGRRVVGRPGREVAVEGLADDDLQHRLELLSGLNRLRLAVAEEVGHLGGRRLRARDVGVVEDLRLEVVELVRVAAVCDGIAAVAERDCRLVCGTRDAVTVQDLDADLGGPRPSVLLLFRLLAESGRGRFGSRDVGVHEVVDRVVDRRLRRRELVVAADVRDLHLLEVPRRQAVGEVRVLVQRRHVEGLASADADLDVLRDRVDDAGDARHRPVGRDLLAHRLYEALLAGDPIEVGVRMAVADVVERLLRGQVLVARVKVDRRVVLAGRVIVEVAVVDVEIAVRPACPRCH